MTALLTKMVILMYTKLSPTATENTKLRKLKLQKELTAHTIPGITSDDLAEGDYIVSYPDSVTEGQLVDIDETYLCR